MDTFKIFIEVLGLLLAITIIVYVVAKLINGNKILISSVEGSDNIIGSQFYYLPSYQITLSLLATVKVKRFSNQEPTYRFEKIDVDVKTEVKPDTSKLIVANYHGSWFSEDDIQIITSEESLLQNISVTSEDRINNILTQITKAPEDLIDSLKPSLRTITATELGDRTLNETYEVNKTLIIPAEDVAKGSFKLPINLRLNKVDGFKVDNVPIELTFKSEQLKTPVFPNTSFNGLFARPITNQTWKLESKPENNLQICFTCCGADSSRLLKVPIKSSFFIKKVQMPKFSNGVLIENHIVKPSEIEGFASIPINILKAIFSIPAQLLQFKIVRNKLETEYDKSLQDIMNVQAQIKSQQDALDQSYTEQQNKISDLQNMPANKLDDFSSLPLEKQEAIAKAAISENFEIWKAKYPNITGCSFSDKKTNNEILSQKVIVFYVSSKRDEEYLRNSETIPKKIMYAGVFIPTDVQVMAPIKSYSNIKYPGDSMLPETLGTNVSKATLNTYGTVSLKVKREFSNRTDYFLISCFHVIYPEKLNQNILDKEKKIEIIETTEDIQSAVTIPSKSYRNQFVPAKQIRLKGFAKEGRFSPVIDVALVKIQNEDLNNSSYFDLHFPSQEISKEGFLDDLSVNLPVTAYGCVSGKMNGIIIKISEDKIPTEVDTPTGKINFTYSQLIKTSLKSTHGDSGAPVVTTDGKCIGILIGGDGDSISYILPYQFIKNTFGITL